MSHLPLDARAILHYLNELGYTNITATQLKEFLKDLRKLIKYEEHVGVNLHNDDYYEGLFRRTTASYRAKIDQENARQKNYGCNHVSSTSLKKEANLKKQSHSIQKENQPKVFVTEASGLSTTTNKSYREILEENRISNYHCKNRNPKNVLEKYYENWQTVKTKNDQQANHNNNNNIEFTKQSSGKINLNGQQITKEIIDEVLEKIRTSSINETKQNESATLKTPIYSRVREMVIKELREQLEKNLNQKLATQTNETIKDRGAAKSFERCISSASPTLTIKSNSTKIKRLPLDRMKKPEWQATQTNEGQGVTENNKSSKNDKCKLHQCQQRSKSPHVCSINGSSGRTTNSSSRYRSRSVLVSRSSSSLRRRKPRNSDPVSLYQYYKNEWEHFSKQIPGQTNHQKLRWQIKQRLMDVDS